MKLVLLFLALIGCAMAFSPGKTYTYTYNGRIGMGIPEIRNKVSGSGIKCDVVFQVFNGGKVIAKFSNVLIGEYFGDVDCNLGTPMPIKYSPLQGYAKTLEEPFEFSFKNSEGEVMIVPKTDLEWVVNLRKSVAQMFLMEPLKMNFETYRIGTPFPKTFSKFEKTFHGECKCEYTMIPLTDSMTEIEKTSMLKKMTKDIEFNEISTEPMYKMVRNIDFNDCKDRVEYVRGGFGNFTDVSKNQWDFIKSRVSVATFNLVGKPGSFRVQSGLLQGSTSVNPFISNNDKLMSITNQTISLVSVTEMKKAMDVSGPTKSIKTWFMEVASPFAPPHNPVPWINYYSKPSAAYAPFLIENMVTGIPITETDIKKFTTQLDTMIKDIATRLMEIGGIPTEKTDLWNTNEAIVMSQMDTATKLVPGIDVVTLQKMFDQFYNDKSEIGQMKLVVFVDICAASGAGSPTKMLLNNFKNGKLSNERITSIFMTFTNHFMAVPLIPDIIEYMKTLNLKETPFMTTMVWMNFATTVKKYCIIDPTTTITYKFPTIFFGNLQCDADYVYTDLMNFFNQKLSTVETSWERTVILQTISNLGSQKSLSTFKTILNGDFDMIVKRSAIQALTLEKIGYSSRKEVFSMLMPIVEDFTADTLLRQMALTTLFSWGPSPSFWQRLAVNSWKEPSKVMGAFVYQMMKSYGQTKTNSIFSKDLTPEVSKFLLPFTKSYSQSPKYSYGTFKSSKSTEENLKSDFLMTILKDDKAAFPLEIVQRILTTYGNTKFSPLKVSMFFDNLTPSKMNAPKESISEKIRDVLSTDKDITQSITDIIQKMIPLMMDNGSMKEGNFLLKMFDNSQFFVPLNMDTFSKAFIKDGVQFVKSWMEGTKMHLTKFFNVDPVEIFTPTDMGLPLIEKYGMPFMTSAEGLTKLTVPGTVNPTIFDLLSMKNLGMEFDSNYKFAFKSMMTLCSIVPWSEKTISVGTETMKNLNLPGKFTMDLKFKDNIENITFVFVPRKTNTVPFVGANFQNIPYTLIRPMYPGTPYTEFEMFEVITVKGDKLGQTQKVIPFDEATYGMKGFTKFEGDVSYPFTFGHMIDLFYDPIMFTKLFYGSSSKLWSSVFVFDFQKSETKSIKTSVAFTLTPTEETNKNSIPKTMKFKDFKDMSKYPNMFTMYLNTLFEGTFSRFFETSFKMLSTKDTTMQSDILFTFMKSEVPHYKMSPINYCFKMTSNTPLINDFHTFVDVMKTNKMSTVYNGVLRGGMTCKDGQIASFKGQLKLTDERKDQLVKELSESCNFEVTNPVASFKTAPVFDKITFRADFKQPFPEFAMNTTYQFYDYIKGYNYPHVYTNYMNIKNQPNVMSFTGKRIMGEDKWTINAQLPRENIILDKFQFPIMFDQLVPLVN